MRSRYYHLQAPVADGAVLVYPSFDEMIAEVEANRRLLSQAGCSILGVPLAELRSEVAEEIQAMTGKIPADTGSTDGGHGASLVFNGHQPELFHPGVWVKNFVLHRLGRAVGARPVHLIVDNDVVKSPSVRVPLVHLPLRPAESDPPVLGHVAFDRGLCDMPWEEREVADRDYFESFPSRLPGNWPFRPLAETMWPAVREESHRARSLASSLAAGRRAIEQAWNCHNVEVFASDICDSRGYRRFLLDVLVRIERFHSLHNRLLLAFRRRHGIKSRNHPVPALARSGGWLEVPFWYWRSGTRQRQRLFVRTDGQTLELAAGNRTIATLRCADTEAAIEELGRLRAEGHKIRSRALTNTMFLRIFASDYFIHGLGGGKYDAFTDELIREYYGVQPPAYGVVTGTLRLPLPRYPCDEAMLRRLRCLTRDMVYNPQRHLREDVLDSPKVQSLLAERDCWLRKRWRTWKERTERFNRLQQITAELRQYLGPQLTDAEARVARCQAEVEANAILGRRDYAFCLYPEDDLRSFCTEWDQRTVG